MENTTNLLGDKATIYVKNIANDLGVIKSSKLEAIIKKAPTLTAAEVNKKLLALAKTEKSKNTITDETVLSKIASMGTFKKEKMIKELEAKKDSSFKRVDEVILVWTRELGVVADCIRRIKTLNGTEDKNGLDKQVKEVVENPFYTFLKIDGESIVFTTQEVIMRWQKKKANLSYEFNLGSFLVYITPSAGKAQIFSHENNITRGSYIHPHIRGDGGVCWGNAEGAIRQIAELGDIRPAMAAIEGLLHTYNEESPYASIEHFYEAFEEKKKLAGLKGDKIITRQQITTMFVAYFDTGYLLKDLVNDLKFPIKVSREGNFLCIPAFCPPDGNGFIALKDGSFAKISRVLKSYNACDQMNPVGNDLEDCLVRIEQKSGYYRTINPTFDADTFFKTTPVQKNAIMNAIRYGQNLDARFKEAKDAIK